MKDERDAPGKRWIGICFLERNELAAVSPMYETESEARAWCEDADERSGGNFNFRVWNARELFDGSMFVGRAARV